MKHTREQLERDASQALGWASAARAAGREADASALERLADVSACAAARFATGAGFVEEEQDSATAVSRAGYFAGSQICADVSDLTDCCPWSKCGICKGCPYNHSQWIYAGKRYECLTAWSVRAGGHRPETRQEPENRGSRPDGIIYRPQDIP